MDFFKVSVRAKGNRSKIYEIYPDFLVGRFKDIMVRGGAFYAIWDEEKQLWSTDEYDVVRLIDQELKLYYENNKAKFDDGVVDVKYMKTFDSNSWNKFKKLLKLVDDNYVALDTKLTFSNTVTKKTDYISKRLPYPLEEGSIEAYDKLMSVLYTQEERWKIEWTIGAIISGDSKKIQKFLVLYGEAGTGKSTVLNIMQKLFDGYYTVFEAKELGSNNSQFALEMFKSNPLVAIQHDGDLSRIEDNTKLNSIISHETMKVNEKFKSPYAMKFNCLLIMATNKPVKITDAKSGIIRRLIDAHPTGNKIPVKEYNNLTEQINFEIGAIANHCLKVYQSMGKNYYNSYKPFEMMDMTDPFFAFIEDVYPVLKEKNYITLKSAYAMYKEYCEDSKIEYPFNKQRFKQELKNYYKEFRDWSKQGDEICRYCYIDFIEEKLGRSNNKVEEKERYKPPSLTLDETTSIFDEECADCPAQYATEDETPKSAWDNCKTKLSGINTKKLHYVRVPENHIVIDFDLKDKDGKKNYILNAEAASKWPPTYAELSKGGQGIHLHYIYDGDVSQLSSVYDKDIEVKVFTGKSSLRRKLTKCNNIPIAHISSGLPLKEKRGKKVVSEDVVKNEKALRTLVKNNLSKVYHADTKSSVCFIAKILEDAYNSGMSYDLSDMQSKVLSFAASSTHQSDTCIKMVNKMKFKSDDIENSKTSQIDEIIFYDVEVFPNLFLVNWKKRGEHHKVVRMINPTSEEIENLLKYKLVGFNCRRYDNHIMYARLLNYSNAQLYSLSQKIVSGESGCFFGEAYNLSYTDVYDFCAKKQSLKKWEIELGIHHQELGLPWDKPVAEELWPKVAEYCDNDVIATEKVFEARYADFIAREILADVAGMSVNDTTNSLTTRIIFGTNKHPNLVYTDLSEEFPGYEFVQGEDKKFHNMYRGEDVGFGGYVYANPGMYGRTITFDVASMHPSSIIALNMFGEYTKNFKDLLDARIAIKHKDWEAAKNMLGGKLIKYLDDESKAKALAQALKIAINSVYGLTSASFDNPFRDIRNKNNIVALRGALFMVNLKHEVESRGFQVVHIKTDSIKVENPDDKIMNYIFEYGKKYGYNFEIEHIFEKICLVNNAVYIAKLAEDDPEEPGKWTATGTQFAVPYVFKTLFSKEPIIFDDMCETKEVNGSMYLDLNENLSTEFTDEYERLTKVRKKYEKDGRDTTEIDEKIDSCAKAMENEHNYIFIGKVGNYCPIKPGCGGGKLLREKDGKYSAVTGTKDHRWLESETVRANKRENDIDLSYYIRLVDEAKDTIAEFGDVEMFISGTGKNEEVPFEEPYKTIGGN